MWPLYDAVASMSYLIITVTNFELVRPSSERSVLATYPLGVFHPWSGEVGVSETVAATNADASPDAVLVAVTVSSATSATAATRIGTLRTCRSARFFSLRKPTPLPLWKSRAFPRAPADPVQRILEQTIKGVNICSNLRRSLLELDTNRAYCGSCGLAILR